MNSFLVVLVITVQGPEPTPPWLAWRVFHSSLEFYAQRSPADLNAWLAKQFGLSSTQAAGVLGAGKSFV